MFKVVEATKVVFEKAGCIFFYRVLGLGKKIKEE
jgi:hypothetical protein